MNLLLFASEGDLRHIKPSDPRLAHVRQVLKLRPGERMYAGVLGGRRAWATLLRDDPQEGMFTEPEWEPHAPPQPLPLRMLVGLPRPQTARRILFEAAVFGVARLDFFQAEKGEPSYAQSSLWHSPEWRERLLLGAEQACVTDLPQVRHFTSLAAALEDSTPLVDNAPTDSSAPTDSNQISGANNASAPAATRPDTAAHTHAAANSHPNAQASSTAAANPLINSTAAANPSASPAALHSEVRLALDIYEAVAPLSHLLPTGTAPNRWLTLAIGAERGWSASERTLLNSHDFLLTHIGERILRAETAFVAALTLCSDKLSQLDP